MKGTQLPFPKILDIPERDFELFDALNCNLYGHLLPLPIEHYKNLKWDGHHSYIQHQNNQSDEDNLDLPF